MNETDAKPADSREQELTDEIQAALSTGDAYTQARALNRRAVHRAETGRDRPALDDLDDALSACERAPLSNEVLRLKASVLSNQGQILALRSSWDEARRVLLEALDLRQQANDVSGEILTLGHLGYVAHTLGRYGEALRTYDRAIARMGEAVDREEERERISDVSQAAFLNNLAAVIHDLGDSKMAAKGYREARKRFEAGGDRRRAMAARINEATLEEEAGSTEVAAQLYGEAVAQARAANDSVAEGSALVNLGSLLLDENDEEADEVLNRAQLLLAEIGDRVGLSRVLQHRARGRRSTGDFVGAEGLLWEALELQEGTDDRDGQRATLVSLASTVRALGRREEGLNLYERAVRLIEETRGELRDKRHHMLRQSYFAQSLSAYDDYCLALVEDAGDAESASVAGSLGIRAFEIAERRRARELRALLEKRGSKAEASPAAPLETVQRSLLGPNSALLAYVVSKSAGVCFCATKDEFAFWPLDVGETELHLWTVGFRAWAEAGSERPAPFAGELSGSLLERPLDWLRGRAARIDRIVIVPDASLNLLPFACLPLSDNPSMLLVDVFETEITPSAGIAVKLAERREGMKGAVGFLGFGDPLPQGRISEAASELGLVVTRRGAEPSQLEHSAAELEAIQALFARSAAGPAKLLLAAKNTKPAAEDALLPGKRRWRYVHFATHGLIDADVPELSGLLFSPAGEDSDPYWRVPAIATSDIGAELVVASACDTAVGKTVAGEGVLGLARAFLIAGAASVCATLWKVPDRSTATLMEAFYKELLDGRDPAAALRMAQRRIRHEELSHPLYWAGFAVFR